MLTRPAFALSAPWRLSARAAPPVVESPPVPNLRDVASAAPGLARTGILYRGAAPACVPHDSQVDAAKFLSNVSRFIDLRTRDERVLDPHDRIRDLCGNDYSARVNAIPLLNRRRVLSGLARVLPPYQFRELMIQSLWSPKSAKAEVIRRMDQGGLLLLNRIILEAGGPAMARSLRAITRALFEERRRVGIGFVTDSSINTDTLRLSTQSSLLLERPPVKQSSILNGARARSTTSSMRSRHDKDSASHRVKDLRPVYIFCSAGKDRTGLLVALILSILGATEDQIIRDYVKSAETWENGPYFLRADYSRTWNCSTFFFHFFCRRSSPA